MLYLIGKVYEYTSIIAHTPNTVTARSPAQETRRWKERPNIDAKTQFFYYNLYYKDDIVEYRGNKYKCIADYSINTLPTVSSVWAKI